MFEGFEMRQKKKGLEEGSQTVASGSNFILPSLISCTFGLSEKGDSADDGNMATGQPGGQAEQGGGVLCAELTCSASEPNTRAASTQQTVTCTVARLDSQECIKGARNFSTGSGKSTRQ